MKKFGLNEVIKAVAEHTDTRLAFLDRNFNFIWVNPSFARGAAYYSENLLGKNLFDLFLDESQRPILQKIIDTGQKLELNDWPFEYPRMGVTYWDVTLTQVKRPTGEVVGLVLSQVDTTKRKNAEKVLVESEKRYRELVESMQEGLWVVNREAITTYINPQLANMLGYSIEEMQGKSIFSFMDEQGIALAKSRLTRRQQGIREQHDFEFIKKDGTRIYTHLDTAPIMDERGNYTGMLATVEDITEKRRIENALKESEARYRVVTENMQGGVLLFESGKGVYANQRATEILGYSREELFNMQTLDFPVPEEKERLLKIMQQTALSQAPSVDMDCWIMRKNGGRRYVRVRYSRISETGQPTRFFIILNDITELKLAEMRLQNLYEEERELRQKLENEIQKRIQFTHALVHELKTPLTPILTSSEMLDRALTEGVPSRLAKNIYMGAEVLNKRIDELLELARMEVGTFKLNLQSMNLLELIENTVGYLTPMVSKNQQLIDCNLPESLPVINADPDRLRQVLMNLITNAARYSSAGTRINISAREENGSLVVEVKDNGKGISVELQKRMFEPYFRIENDQERLSGLDLGLPISKNIVELHGGQIWVNSKPGKGSTFSFSIPINKLD